MRGRYSVEGLQSEDFAWPWRYTDQQWRAMGRASDGEAERRCERNTLMMPGCKDGWSRSGWIGVVMAGLAVWGASSVQGQATPPASAPAGAATQPAPTPAEAVTPVPASKPAPAGGVVRPILTGQSIEEVSSLTAEEKGLIDLAIDGDEQYVTTGLYVLLRRAAMMPGDEEAYSTIKSVDPPSFWSAPAVLRGRLVRFDGLYFGPAEAPRPVPNEWWAGNRFYLVNIKQRMEGPTIIVALTEPPPAELRKGTKLGIAGFFFKNVLLRVDAASGNPAEKHLYPVVVAKKIYRVPTDISSPLGGSTGVLVAIAGGLVIFAMVRAYIRAKQRQVAEARQEALVAAQASEAPPEDFDIDPELGRQVEEFQAEHPAGQDDGQGKKGRKA